MAEEKRKNLGRGLSALLGEVGLTPSGFSTIPNDPANPAAAPVHNAMPNVPVAALEPSRFQPRRRFDEDSLQELADSIRVRGLLQPILVRPHPTQAGQYEIIAGERRWRAAQRAQLHEVPVLIKSLTDREAAEIALVENLQRRDLSPLEEAEGFRRLLDEFKHTQDELARALGKSRSHVTNTLRLLGLPDALKAQLEDGQLSAGHARALLSAADPEGVAAEVLAKGLSVRQTEALVAIAGKAKANSTAKAKPQARVPPMRDTDVAALEQDLARSLGLKVALKTKGAGGELTLHYRTLEQLDDILSRLSGEKS